MWNRCLNGYGLEDVSGFIKQNSYGAPQGVCCFLCVLAVSLMKEIRNVHLITHTNGIRPGQLAVFTCQLRESQLRPDSSWHPDEKQICLQTSSQRVFPFVYRAGLLQNSRPPCLTAIWPLTHILTGHPRSSRVRCNMKALRLAPVMTAY